MMNNDIEWKMVKLGEVATIIRGGSPRPIEDYITDSSDGINWIKIGDVAVGAKYIEHTEEKIISEGLYKSRSVKAGDFLLSNSMSFGRPYILKIDGAIHDGWLAIQNYEKTFQIEYLYYVLSTDFVLNQYKSLAAGSSVLNLNKQIVAKVNIPLPYKNGAPDLETQKQIAQKLGDMDSLIAAKEKLLAKKCNLKVAAMQKLFKAEDSENWKKVKLGELCSMPTKTILTNTFDSKYYIGTENMLQNCSGIIDNEIVLSYGRVREYKKEDILMSNIRPYLKKIWFSDKKAGCSTDVNIFRANGKCVPKYLFHVLCQDDFFNFVNDNAIGTKMPRGDKRIIPTFLVSIPYKNGTPDIVEQSRIVSILSEMDTEIFSIENELIKLQNLKTGMMQSYFSFNEVEE